MSDTDQLADLRESDATIAEIAERIKPEPGPIMVWDTYIRWNDDSPVVAARIGPYSTTVDAAGLIQLIRATAGPDGLRQYFDDTVTLETILGLASLPAEEDGRYDITPLAGEIVEVSADGVEL